MFDPKRPQFVGAWAKPGSPLALKTTLKFKENEIFNIKLFLLVGVIHKLLSSFANTVDGSEMSNNHRLHVHTKTL